MMALSGVAFAPASTWMLTSTFSHRSRPSRFPTIPRFPHYVVPVTAVIDNSFNSNPSRYNPQLPESVDSMHGRLGIQQLWLPDHNSAPNTPQDPLSSNPDAHSSSSSSSDVGLGPDVNATDIPVLNDGGAPSVTAMPWDTTGSGAQAISLLGRRVQALRKRQLLLNKSYEECRRITALFSKTFYLGTSLLCQEKRRAVWAIYTWCRRTDDLVDGPRVSQRSDSLRDTLSEWEERLVDIFKGRARDALDLALVDAIQTFPEVTPAPFLDMIKGMLMDVDQDRFETFDNLYLYCYRVAGTVGLMTLPVMGTRYPGRDGLRAAADSAVALGIGLQLTNILRDVGEDRLRGRIYLPLEDLRRFNYSEKDLFNCVRDSRYRSLIKFQVARARRYFRQAQRGVYLLSDDSRFPVQASLDMYSQILDVIEENEFDNFDKRAYISKTRKLLTLPISFLRSRETDAWKPLLTAVEFMTGRKS